MTRAEILEKNLRIAEEGIIRIKKLLPNLDKENRDLPFSVISYSISMLRNTRNIEIDVSGKSQEEVDKLYQRSRE